ncbi:DNA-directed RNA polymerase III subunit RPC2 [Nematocida sp. AWRm77]|nr:DNA-directed RNA polymerase III subunit RPC2 [Nematocida sp. AWRm77]
MLKEKNIGSTNPKNTTEKDNRLERAAHHKYGIQTSYHTVAEHIIQEKGLNSHHIDSFNHFIDAGLKTVLEANSCIDSDIDPQFYFKYTDIRVEAPSVEENMVKRRITPAECRIRNLTYAGDILVDVEYTRGKDIVASKNVQIGRIPIMVGSRLSLQKSMQAGTKPPPVPNIIEIENPKYKRPPKSCPHDIGGYFICKGVERVLLMQEQLSKNRIHIEEDVKGDLSATVTSSSLERKSKTKVVLKKKLLYLSHNSLTEDVPLSAVLKGMGVETDLEIEALIGQRMPGGPRLRTSLEALLWLGARIKTRAGGVEEARIFLCEIILAHVPGTGAYLRKKAEYLAEMGRKLLVRSKGESTCTPENDKDFVGNKRIELSGQMLALLFEDLLKRLNSEMKKAVDRVLCKRARAQEMDALHFLAMQRGTITSGLQRAIGTGSWSLKRFRMDRSGVTQVLSRLSRLAAVGMCARVSSQFEKTRKISGPRALHCSQWGVFCPADTPEGEACGLVKSLATLSEITQAEDAEAVVHALSFLGAEDTDTLGVEGLKLKKCWVNGIVEGLCRGPVQIAHALRKLRRQGKLPSTIGIWAVSDLNVSTEAGRLCRLLIIVEHGAPRVTAQEVQLLESGHKTLRSLLAEGRVEYIDQNEAANMQIATWAADITEETTHLEIDPSTILGHVAGVIPYPHHNQSPRNTYQCAMGKQSVGVTGVDQLERMDGNSFFLVSPQRPLAGTRAMEQIGYNSLPAGQNLTIAVMSMTGYDIEDALVLNNGSVQRGIGRALLFKTHSLSLRTYPGGGADTITEEGVPGPGQKVTEGAVFIDRKTPTGANAGLVYRGLDRATVDRTAVLRAGDDLVTVKTVLKEHRIPRVGDKFSSRHGQKGVVGLVLPQEDMPFNEQGVSPDLIMNPHGFPSRMTVGKILELATGKVRALGSSVLKGDAATAFGGVSAHTIAKELEALGYSKSGKETLICGTTGRRVEADIFFGPVFYQRLKHMVSDKIHARARGPRAVLTRQPTEGRCKDGGFRLGEMERDCLIGYGAAEILVERLVVSSDKFSVFVCSQCGLLGNSTGCASCKTSALHKLQMPYACKLLFQELLSMHIAPRISIKTDI